MDYKVVVTAEAEEDLNQFIQYLLFAKKNKQAAKNVLDDFEKKVWEQWIGKVTDNNNNPLNTK